MKYLKCKKEMITIALISFYFDYYLLDLMKLNEGCILTIVEDNTIIVQRYYLCFKNRKPKTAKFLSSYNFNR